jgi:hypothetical protein
VKAVGVAPEGAAARSTYISSGLHDPQGRQQAQEPSAVDQAMAAARQELGQ